MFVRDSHISKIEHFGDAGKQSVTDEPDRAVLNWCVLISVQTATWLALPGQFKDCIKPQVL